MIRLARFSTRRPFAAFAAWLALAVALAAIGLGISHSLSPTIVVVPGSETARAEHLAESNFGPSVLVPVLLEGPKAQLDAQGPALVKALAARRDTRVLSAWDIGDAAASLRPDATHAMLVASVAQTEEQMVDGVQAEIDRIVAQQISAPVTPFITGTPTIDLATKDQSLDTARRAELLALPILFLILLVILRAPVAALVLTAFGGMTTLMSFGAMALLGKLIDVDPTAVTLASMAGLALGVSYALLVYWRWRSERRAVHAHDRAGEALAASRAVETAGRAVLIGGTALVASLAAGAAHRAEYDPDLARHRRHALRGARDRRRGRRHAGRDDHPRPSPAGVLLRSPGLPHGSVAGARRPRRELGHPLGGPHRRGRDGVPRDPGRPDAEPPDGTDLARPAAEGRPGAGRL